MKLFFDPVLSDPGVTLELYVEQEEYVVELTEDAGIRLLLHPNEVMPFPEDGGMLLAPGVLTLFSMKMVGYRDRK